MDESFFRTMRLHFQEMNRWHGFPQDEPTPEQAQEIERTLEWAWNLLFPEAEEIRDGDPERTEPGH